MSPSRSVSSDRSDPVLVFQGDSITDAGRQRADGEPNRPQALGCGYAMLAASQLLGEGSPQRWRCYNRAIGGDRVDDLAARWDVDCLSLEPDVLSILVGVNDFWHTVSGASDRSADEYERRYHALLDRTCEALPDVTLLLGEPFAVPGGSAVDEEWHSHFDRYQRAARRVADDYGATWIPYQSVFNASLDDAPASYWAPDGVHPTAAGHYRMAQTWMEAFRARQSD